MNTTAMSTARWRSILAWTLFWLSISPLAGAVESTPDRVTTVTGRVLTRALEGAIR